MPLNTLEMDEAALDITKDAAAAPSPPQPDVVEPTGTEKIRQENEKIHQEAIRSFNKLQSSIIVLELQIIICL